MNILQSTVYGIIQGVTEFLPISSSGHLLLLDRIAPYIPFSDTLFPQANIPLSYIVLLHIATMCSVFIVFRNTIMKIIQGLVHAIRGAREEQRDEATWAVHTTYAIIISTLAAIPPAFMLRSVIETLSPHALGYMFLATAVILILPSLHSAYTRGQAPQHNITHSKKPISIIQALVIGIAQGCAAVPGISRSGTTISTGMLLGIPRTQAAEYSLLIFIPLNIAASLFTIISSSSRTQLISQNSILSLGIGCFSAFIVGIVSLKILLKVLQKSRLWVFSLYLCGIGSGILIFL